MEPVTERDRPSHSNLAGADAASAWRYGPPHRRQRRGGALIHYGAAQSLSHFLFLVLKLVIYNLLPNGKGIKGYGTIVVTSR